ncbi:MAG: hypothetical protein QXS83_02295, partial [Thermoplasmata archaeon]
MSNILTDADGYFYINLQGSTEGITYIIEVTKEGYNVTRKNVTVFAGYITDAGTIGISVLPPQPEFPWWLLILAILIAIGIVLLLFFLLRRKPREAKTLKPETEVKPKAPPEARAATTKLAPPQPPQEQKKAPAPVCSVCLKEISQGEVVYQCTCGALSHGKCITVEGKCPLCGKELSPELRK